MPVTVTFDVVPSVLAVVPLNVNSALARMTFRLPSISDVTLIVVPFFDGVNVSTVSDAFLPSVSVSMFGVDLLFRVVGEEVVDRAGVAPAVGVHVTGLQELRW